MAVTISAVPEKISRADYARLIESVGIEIEHLVSLTFHAKSIEAVVFALNSEGRCYAVPDTNEVALHTISIPVEG